ncbi:MAG: hypothetical protein ACE5F8_02695, partial [Woeseiaceae bacterium]
VVHQPRRVYYYYPDPCPVYYYPYPGSHSFRRGYFWGVTTAFTIGWASDRLRVYHPSYTGHPYYGRHYWNRWWYRRPSITVYNNLYINHYRNLAARRYSHGDYWRPSGRTRLRYTDQRITRNRYYGNRAQEVADRRVYPNNSRHTVRRESTRDNVIRRQSRRSDEHRRPRQRSRSERNAPDERRMVQIARSDAQRREQRRGPDRQARQRDRQPPPARQSRQRDRQPPPVHQSRQRDRQPAPVRESRNRTPQRDAERESRAKRSEGSRSQRKRGGRRRHN